MQFRSPHLFPQDGKADNDMASIFRRGSAASAFSTSSSLNGSTGTSSRMGGSAVGLGEDYEMPSLPKEALSRRSSNFTLPPLPSSISGATIGLSSGGIPSNFPTPSLLSSHSTSSSSTDSLSSPNDFIAFLRSGPPQNGGSATSDSTPSYPPQPSSSSSSQPTPDLSQYSLIAATRRSSVGQREARSNRLSLISALKEGPPNQPQPVYQPHNGNKAVRPDGSSANSSSVSLSGKSSIPWTMVEPRSRKQEQAAVEEWKAWAREHGAQHAASLSEPAVRAIRAQPSIPDSMISSESAPRRTSVTFSLYDSNNGHQDRTDSLDFNPSRIPSHERGSVSSTTSAPTVASINSPSVTSWGTSIPMTASSSTTMDSHSLSPQAFHQSTFLNNPLSSFSPYPQHLQQQQTTYQTPLENPFQSLRSKMSISITKPLVEELITTLHLFETVWRSRRLSERLSLEDDRIAEREEDFYRNEIIHVFLEIDEVLRPFSKVVRLGRYGPLGKKRTASNSLSNPKSNTTNQDKTTYNSGIPCSERDFAPDPARGESAADGTWWVTRLRNDLEITLFGTPGGLASMLEEEYEGDHVAPSAQQQPSQGGLTPRQQFSSTWGDDPLSSNASGTASASASDGRTLSSSRGISSAAPAASFSRPTARAGTSREDEEAIDRALKEEGRKRFLEWRAGNGIQSLESRS